MKLSERFYRRTDVVRIARELLGKCLFTKSEGAIAGGIIVETEAYSWKERGCHAYGGKRTDRTAVMFNDGGCAYVYLIYGIHNLFNIVTNRKDIAEAVLVRAIEPFEGESFMAERRGPLSSRYQLTSGPGKLTKALGIDRNWNGKSLLDSEIWIEDVGRNVAHGNILAGPRIGIDYAMEDAALPWRFTVKGNLWLSK